MTRAWRSRSTPEYNAWLYQRRKLRFWIAESGFALLEEIASGKTKGMQKRTQRWLEEVRRRQLEVGTRFDHEANRPHSPK